MRRLLRRAGPRPSDLVHALLGQGSAGVAVLGPGCVVRRANPLFQDLSGLAAGQSLAPLLPEPARADALAGRSCTALLQLGEREVLLDLSAARAGAVALLLERTRERVLESQLAQARRLQSVGQFAGGIAHDFNNLLTAILASAEEALARAPEAGIAAELAQIKASASRGAALVRQILAFGRQQTLRPRVLALNQAVANAAGMLQRILPRSIELDLQLEEPGRLVRIDPSQLDQVLVNLAANARDAMPQGGRFTLATRHRTLLRPEIDCGEEIAAGRYAVLEARDTGGGIPAEVLPHIFEPFFTTRREEGGTGLGLSTVDGIVRQSGGRLVVQSRPGEGACFRIYLPRHERPEAEPGEPRPALGGPPEAAGRLILLVEDETPIRTLAQRRLTRAGWEVAAAASGEEGLALLRRSKAPPACVISDVVMPGMDGPALVRAVRAAHGPVPALLISGYAEERLRREIGLEATAFMAKPFDMAALEAAVRDLTRAPAVA